MWWSVLVWASALFIIYITHWAYRWSNPKCKGGGKLPPGSMGFPFIGETLELKYKSYSLDLAYFFRKRIDKYGSIFRTSLVGRPVVITSDPDFSHFILQQEGKLVDLWHLDSLIKLLVPDASFLTIGYTQKYARNFILNHFGKESIKNKLLPQLEELARQNLNSWLTHSSSINVKEAFSTMIFDWTAELMFSYDPKRSPENLCEISSNFLASSLSFPVNIPGTAFNKYLKKQKLVTKMLKNMIEERRQNWQPEKRAHDVLDDIMEDMKQQEFLTDDLAVMVVFGLLLATSQPVSTTLALAIKFLLDHPSALEDLRVEHEAIRRRKDEGSSITWEDYKSMIFTSYVINETLRFADVTLGIIRRAKKDISYKGYIIPSGWLVVLLPLGFHLNPDKFPDPLAFNPWRWKDIGVDVMTRDFLAFGRGPRACPGVEFTKVCISMILHAIVTKYRLKKIKGGDIVRDPVLRFQNDFVIQILEK